MRSRCFRAIVSKLRDRVNHPLRYDKNRTYMLLCNFDQPADARYVNDS